MGDFFKGWRRKAGGVTLAMALLLTVAWMRSYLIVDTFRWTVDMRVQSIISGGGRLGLIDYLAVPNDRFQLASIAITDTLAGRLMRLRDESDVSMWSIPYWSLVLPLTLLSAWLILAKPRKETVPQASSDKCLSN